MKLGYKYIVFLFMFLFVGSFIGQSQVADVRPPKTKMVDRSLEELEGAAITRYRYQSNSSKKQIAQFYRLLFKNRGFKEMKGRGSANKAFFFFTKQKEGVMVILTFLGPKRKGVITYSLTNHHFGLKENKAASAQGS